jgi:hypothetical protein
MVDMTVATSADLLAFYLVEWSAAQLAAQTAA